jgi:hypothetical protein
MKERKSFDTSGTLSIESIKVKCPKVAAHPLSGAIFFLIRISS